MNAKSAAMLLTLSACLVMAGCSGGEPPPDPVHWSFLVYLDGDNNLEGALLGDLAEIRAATASEYVEVYALFDRIAGHDASEGDWTDTRLFHLANNTLTQLTTADGWYYDAGTELDMSDPETLRQFITYCRSRPAADGLPAERLVLTIANHGSNLHPRSAPAGGRSAGEGVTRGICWDDTSAPDYEPNWNCLTTDEVAAALSAARAGGAVIDVIQTDACNMQMLEVAYEWRGEAAYLVGSEETVPWNGNDYRRLLTALAENPAMTAGQFARKMVEVYRDYYKVAGSHTTFSALNLGPPFARLIDAFADFAAALRATGDLAGVLDAWRATTTFNGAIYREDKDLVDFALELQKRSFDPAVRLTATRLIRAAEDAITARGNTGRFKNTAYGLAILLPSGYEWPAFSGDNQYKALRLPLETDWDEFIERFAEYTN